jgi:hypothetical protein
MVLGDIGPAAIHVFAVPREHHHAYTVPLQVGHSIERLRTDGGGEDEDGPGLPVLDQVDHGLAAGARMPWSPL